MPSPTRRSARATQPPTKPAPPTSNNSSSSTSSARHDRAAREFNGVGKNGHSATPQSRLSEDMSDPPRRSKRSHPTAEPEILRAAQEADEEAAEDEEEVTRCLCGQPEYPGPPLSEAFNSTEVQSEDAGGLFIQCDGCSVWQHGGCVGIVEESQSPDKYYCEDCRPKQHEVHTDPRGQRYSLYLPVTGHEPTRKNSISNRSDEKARKERAEISRGSLDPSGKRRATMRSREHDEEAEQMARAIEESTREAQGGKRNGKRGRDESNEEKHEIKRQRRGSDSHPAHSRSVAVEDESDDDNEGSNTASRSKKARAEATQSARQVEQREKEKERERARAEAAGRRQQRAGRRRGDEDPLDDTPKPPRTSPPPSSQPDSPPAPSTAPAPEKVSHKKGAGRRVKRLGNNQYTKHRGQDTPTSAAPTNSPHSKKRPLASSANLNGGQRSSSDEHNLPNGNDASNSRGTPDAPAPKGRPPKSKKNAAATNGLGAAKNSVAVGVATEAERTIPTMARNLEGMMAFIQRAQLEVAADRARLGDLGEAGGGSGVNGEEGALGAMEIAEELTKGIRTWQEKFGARP